MACRINEDRFDLLFKGPFQQRGADRFGAITGSDITRRTVQTDEPTQYLNHPRSTNRVRCIEGQAFPRVFINPVRHFSCCRLAQASNTKSSHRAAFLFAGEKGRE